MSNLHMYLHFEHYILQIRIPCPGDCTIEGNIHTFSITELTRKVNTGLACPKCDEIKRLTDEDIAVINGDYPLVYCQISFIVSMKATNRVGLAQSVAGSPLAR